MCGGGYVLMAEQAACCCRPRHDAAAAMFSVKLQLTGRFTASVGVTGFQCWQEAPY